MKMKSIIVAGVLLASAAAAVYATHDNKHLAFTDEIASKCFRAGSHYMNLAKFVMPTRASVNYTEDGPRHTATVGLRYHAPYGGWTTGRVECTFDSQAAQSNPQLVFMSVNGVWVDNINTTLINLIVD